MEVHLAGALTGNLNQTFWEKGVNVFLSGNDGYITKNKDFMNENQKQLKRVNLLESFYYIKDWQIPFITLCNSFLLDSGAFSFMNSKKNEKTDWNKYVDRYCEFINQHKIELFFELDIDSIVGYDKVKLIRKKIESKTGKQCIPVWHKARGKDDFYGMCKDYNYVSIGGIVTKEFARTDKKFFNGLCDIAHSNNAKIHALGFTNSDLANYKFDSVDSTAWLYGNRGGYIYHFDGIKMTKIDAPKGKKLKGRAVAVHNFWEWIKYGEYLSQIVYSAGTSTRDYILKEQ